MSAPTVVRVSDVSKRFVIHKEKSLKERALNWRNRGFGREDFWALRDVSVDIAAGETVGLIGANGSGKSTLLKVIGGIIQPTSGVVAVGGRIAALLELGAGFHPDLTGRENVYLNAAILGLSQQQTDRHFEDIVEFSGIREFIDTQVKFYSSGMYVRLAFAVAIHVDPEILLVDEVLAVGDEPFQQKCLDKIRQFQHEGRTIVLVSHSADAIGQYCDRAVVLRHGVVQFDGDTAGGLRVLRDGFAEEQGETSDARPTDGAQIVATELRHRGGAPVAGVLQPGADLEFEIVVDTRGESLDGWVVGLAIETPLGHRVFGTNTERLGIRAERFSGRRSFTFSLPDVRLGSGRYHVRAALETAERGTFSDLLRAAVIDVDDGTRNAGQLAVAARVAIDDLD